MWDLVKVRAENVNQVNEYLGKGYEPFAVSVDTYSSETVWLKKEVEDAIQEQTGAEELSKKVLPKKRRKTKD